MTFLPETYRRDYTDSAIGCAAGQAADNLHEEFRGNPSFDWDNSNDNNQIRILGMLAECFTTDDQRGWFELRAKIARSRSCAFRTCGQPWENSRAGRSSLGGEGEIPAQEDAQDLAGL